MLRKDTAAKGGTSDNIGMTNVGAAMISIMIGMTRLTGMNDDAPALKQDGVGMDKTQ